MTELHASLLLALLATACVGSAANLEQAAMDTVAETYWGADLFGDECTGLRLEPGAPLRVFADGPGYRISLLDVPTLAGIDLKAAAQKEGGLADLERAGAMEVVSPVVDVAPYPFASRTTTSEPGESWEPAQGYLLRFSNRVRFGDHAYLQVWIKADRSSSGTRIDFEFDTSGKLVASQKHTRCDDWG